MYYRLEIGLFMFKAAVNEVNFEQNTHSLRLVKFITRAGQTLNTLLEEDR